jgi:putative peptide zinc metalloprotease protein
MPPSPARDDAVIGVISMHAISGATMPVALPSSDESFFVIPLSVQKEGEDYCIGNAEIDAFYHFPEIGLRIIERLRRGCTASQIREELAGADGDTVDVDDFVATLREIGFIYPHAERERFRDAVAASKEGDRRLGFRAPVGLARAVFSLPSLVVYLAILGFAAHAAIEDPRLRLNLEAFYLERHLTLTLVLLLLLYGITASMHELGHMLAAARYGVSSRLGFGNRLWSIVAEADLSGILALPKSQRYLPLLAGMIVDLLSIALVTLLLQWLLHQGHSGFAIQLLQALVLQILISMTWQFNVFLKTDIYYVLCTRYGHPDLDREARVYLRDRMHALSLGLVGERTARIDLRHLGMLRLFAALWLIGRFAALGFLILVLIPTLVRYVDRALVAFADPDSGRAAAYDAAAFAAISLLLFAIGMTMWLRRRQRNS